jgi:hypothetical protein
MRWTLRASRPIVRTMRLRPIGPGHPANNIRGDQRTVRRIPHDHSIGSRQRDKSPCRGRAGAHHVLLAILGYDHDLEQSIVTVAARHPVGVHDRDTSRLFTCSCHGANLKGPRFPGEPWNVVKPRGASQASLGRRQKRSTDAAVRPQTARPACMRHPSP